MPGCESVKCITFGASKISGRIAFAASNMICKLPEVQAVLESPTLSRECVGACHTHLLRDVEIWKKTTMYQVLRRLRNGTLDYVVLLGGDHCDLPAK